MIESGLYLGAFLFAVGLMIIIIKKNAIFALMGIELILNAANINLIIFSRVHASMEGEIAAIFSVVLAAAEAAIALSIVILLIKKYKSSDLDIIDELKY